MKSACITAPSLHTLILRVVQAWESLQAVTKHTKQSRRVDQEEDKKFKRISGILLNSGIVYFWKRFHLHMLNVSCNSIFPFEKTLKEEKWVEALAASNLR